MLYHFSENPKIAIFKPERATTDLKAVWAIDDEHSVHYFFPRDCPRICYSKSSTASSSDIDRLFGHTLADRIIVVENRWLEKIRQTKLYRYSFQEDCFELFDRIAGYYISNVEVKPVIVEPMGDILQKIMERNVELRFTPNLAPIREVLAASTLDFSMIRLRNAIFDD